MELNFKLDLEAAAKASQGGLITTGVYTITIEKAYVKKTANGNNIVDFELKSNSGEVGFINAMCIDEKWASGSENFDYAKWQELAVCAGMQSVTLVDTTRKTKDGEKPAKIIGELSGKVVKMALYEEWDVYNNKKVTKLNIANTFYADGRSVAEKQENRPAEKIKKVEARLSIFKTKAFAEWEQDGCATAPSAPAQADTNEDDLDEMFED